MTKNALLKGAFAALLTFLLTIPAFAQNYTAAETKSVEKAEKLFSKKKFDKAITTLNNVQKAHVHDEALWKKRVYFEKVRYDDQFSKDIINLLKKASKGGTVTVDFDKLKSTTYRGELLYSCYAATLYADNQDLASLLLHDMIIEPTVDTTVSEEAKDLVAKGDEEYTQERWSAAIRQYEKAYKMDTNYYNAAFSIAASYYKQEKWSDAIPWYRIAIRQQPEMLNPHYYLIECLKNEKKWQECYDACVEAIIAYPHVGYFKTLEECCDKLGKTMKRHWMERDDMPNMAWQKSQYIPSEEPWSFYRGAKEKIIDFCDDDGIITKSQSQTDSKYMEVYSWEYMLKKSDSEKGELGFARKMQESGNLDCFSMVSMFHIGFWDQYKDFRDNNKNRIRTYINTELVKG
jgi:tetratricopeptide (TPR) repeat protein